MKIAWVIERMDTARGGRETSTAQVVKALASQGHDVTILCQSGSWAHPGVQVKSLGARGRFRHQRAMSFSADVRAMAATMGFDIVHAVTPVMGANVYQPRGGTIPGQRLASARRRRSTRLHSMLEPMNLCRRVMSSLERQIVGDPRVKCLAVSEMIAEEFRRFYSRSQGVSVIYNAVCKGDVNLREQWRDEYRRRLGVGDDTTVFVTAATNFELKGIPQALNHFAAWRAGVGKGKDAKFVAIGADPGRGIIRLVRRLGILDDVAFFPRVDSMFPWYSAGDVCVLLSWYDPCSRVVLEAIRWGLPAITTAYNGAAETLARGGGIVVSSPDDPTVVDAFEELSDPATRARCAQECERVENKISLDQHVENLLGAYAELMRCARR